MIYNDIVVEIVRLDCKGLAIQNLAKCAGSFLVLPESPGLRRCWTAAVFVRADDYASASDLLRPELTIRQKDLLEAQLDILHGVFYQIKRLRMQNFLLGLLIEVLAKLPQR